MTIPTGKNMLSKRFSNIQESKTVALSGTLARMRREGKDVISLGAGEPDFDTPDPIKEAAIQSIRDGFTKYTPADGMFDLKQAVCSWLVSEYGADYGPDQIVITCGAKHAVFQAICAVCNPGDEVLLPAPYWVSYPEQIALAGANARILETRMDSGLKISSAQIKENLTPKTRLLILNSPSNPSGAVYDKSELEEIAALAVENDFYVLADEIYDKIVYDDAEFTSLTQFPALQDRLLLVNGVSKSFAMTGWRIGFLAAPQAIASAVKRFQGHTTSNPASISQMAALQAYRGEKSFQSRMLQAFTERRNVVYERLNQMAGVMCPKPQGAFYAFPDVSHYYSMVTPDQDPIRSGMDLCNFLLMHHGVAIVPGSAFGMENHVRLSFATSMETLNKALDRIEQGLKSLHQNGE
jgi:aspartate/methionine/tyrosine aminotransferase